MSKGGHSYIMTNFPPPDGYWLINDEYRDFGLKYKIIEETKESKIVKWAAPVAKDKDLKRFLKLVDLKQPKKFKYNKRNQASTEQVKKFTNYSAKRDKVILDIFKNSEKYIGQHTSNTGLEINMIRSSVLTNEEMKSRVTALEQDQAAGKIKVTAKLWIHLAEKCFPHLYQEVDPEGIIIKKITKEVQVAELLSIPTGGLSRATEGSYKMTPTTQGIRDVNDFDPVLSRNDEVVKYGSSLWMTPKSAVPD